MIGSPDLNPQHSQKLQIHQNLFDIQQRLERNIQMLVCMYECMVSTTKELPAVEWRYTNSLSTGPREVAADNLIELIAALCRGYQVS